MLVSIGQFSKLTRLSVKALRLYDENGLLPPTHVDSVSGYRYYDPALARMAEIIRVLRQLDVPLDRIRQVLASSNIADVTAQLDSHRQALVDRVATYDGMLLYLVSLLQNQESAMTYEVSISEVAPKTIASVRVRASTKNVAQQIPAGFGKLMQGLMRLNRRPAGVPMLIHHDVLDDETEGDIEVCIPVEQSFGDDADIACRELERGQMATTLHKGPYDRVSPAYHALSRWITSNGYEIAGPPRETYLNDPRQVKPDELLTRIEYPIRLAQE